MRLHTCAGYGPGRAGGEAAVWPSASQLSISSALSCADKFLAYLLIFAAAVWHILLWQGND